MKCSQCRAEVAVGEVFCGECGVTVLVSPSLSRICPKCTTPLEAGERFCGSCGYDGTVATVRPETAATGSSVSAMPYVAGKPSTNTFRLGLVVGLIGVAAILLLGTVVLWLWLGRNEQTNANTQNTNAIISGVWNCQYLPEASEPDHAQMTLTQNGSNVTGTLTSEDEPTTIGGTFQNQVLTITSPKIIAPLTLSPDGRTMTGQVTDAGLIAKIVCTR